MNIIIPRALLNDALNTIKPAMPKISATPLLNNILLAYDPGHIVLRATDGAITISRRINLATPGTGQVLIPAKQLCDIIAKQPDVDLDFGIGGTEAIISRKGSKYKIPLVPSQGYPPEPTLPQPIISLPCSSFRRALELTVHAPASADNRKKGEWVTAIFLNLGGGKLDFVGCDAAVLGLATIHGLEPLLVGHWLLPVKDALALAKSIPNDEGAEVTIHEGEGCLALHWGGTTALFALLTATYPKYGSFIRTENATSVVVDGPELKGALDRLDALKSWGSGDYNIVRLTTAGGELTLEVAQGESGSASESIGCEAEGDDLHYKAKSYALLKAISPVAKGQIKLGASGPGPMLQITSPREPDWLGAVQGVKD